MSVFVASLARTLVDRVRPRDRATRGVGELGEGDTKPHVAGIAERNRAVLPGGTRDRSHPAFGCELPSRREASAVIAEFGEDLGGADSSDAKQWRDRLGVGVCVD